MAARLNPKNDERARDTIATIHLVKRLNSFALSELDPQTDRPVEMSPAQVKAAIALLKKTIPDLQSVEHSGGMTITTHEKALAELEDAAGASAETDGHTD